MYHDTDTACSAHKHLLRICFLIAPTATDCICVQLLQCTSGRRNESQRNFQMQFYNCRSVLFELCDVRSSREGGSQMLPVLIGNDWKALGCEVASSATTTTAYTACMPAWQNVRTVANQPYDTRKLGSFTFETYVCSVCLCAILPLVCSTS